VEFLRVPVESESDYTCSDPKALSFEEAQRIGSGLDIGHINGRDSTGQQWHRTDV
jgi:hypothetical protein